MGRVIRVAIAAAAAEVALWLAPASSLAIEGGASFYLLGSKLPLSGVVPGPGMYFQNDAYFYDGSAGGNIQLPFGGQIIAGVDAQIFFEMPTVIGVTPWEILGGRLGFAGIVPLGFVDVQATLGRFAIQDDVFTVGDPAGSAFLGWDSGNFHWSLSSLVNFPIGDYREGQIANVALHRWAADFTGAATWLDPKLGIDLSAAAGFTFNGENHATDYNSGNEFHFEAAATKYLSRVFSLGIAGYYNRQVSPDSGSRLGAFEGEVGAIGGLATYTFEVGKLPVTTRVKYFHEFEATNRLEGDAVFLTAAMPLWVPPPPPVTK
jgi:hypothetical protein